MPDYRLTDAHTGDSLSLRGRYHGTVTLVNIWATWCVPCRTEMPAMQRAYEALKDQGFRIAAVSIDEDADDAVNRFTESFGLTFEFSTIEAPTSRRSIRRRAFPKASW